MFYEINTPYEADLPLLLKLGLKEFICESNTETYLGQVDSNEFSIDVYVTCMPAQFWKFRILCKEDKRITEIETGSGSFTQYWDIARMIGSNLISVRVVG